THLALAERPHRLRDADEWADDLQRPPASLLGAVWCKFRSPLAFLQWAALSRMGDDPFNLQSCGRAALASRFRLAAGRSAPAVPGDEFPQPSRAARSHAHARGGEAEPYLA